MRSLKRKQLHKLPETNIAHISAVPQWFKVVVPYTDLTGGGNSIAVTLFAGPIKMWVHAVAWKVTTSFSHDGGWDVDQLLQVWVGDEDTIGKWLSASTILTEGDGGEVATDIEDAIGLTPYEPDFDNTHALRAQFGVNAFQTGDLSDLDAGEFTVWFLLSSMNEGAAG